MRCLSIVLDILALSTLLSSIGTFVSPEDDVLLGRYETGNMKFEKLEIGDRIVYWHQRTIEGAIVEGDFILYQFGKKTHELIKKKIHWRDDLPKHLNVRISEDQAKSMVKGKQASARLYIISPESKVFPIKPHPKHPCWVVTSRENRKAIVTIIDAVTGAILGQGIPPPAADISPESKLSEPSLSPWERGRTL